MGVSERKAKTCPDCEKDFYPYTTIEKRCIPCARIVARAKIKKRYDKETREMKRKHRENDRSYHLKRAQAAFNAYIRERDRYLPCISSGRTTGQMHAGHYKSIGAHPELRFNEFNCNKQSMKDNAWLSGNILGYRDGLIKKYGIEVVEELEGPHPAVKYTIDDLKEITAKFKAKTKEIREK